MNAPENGKTYSLLGIAQGKTWAESEVRDERLEELREEVEWASDRLDDHNYLIEDKRAQLEELRGELEDLEEERTNLKKDLAAARQELLDNE
jgi:chromosome segregation ATPase